MNFRLLLLVTGFKFIDFGVISHQKANLNEIFTKRMTNQKKVKLFYTGLVIRHLPQKFD